MEKLRELPEGRYDAHVHVYPGAADSKAYVAKLAEAGIRGGAVFSENPCPANGTKPMDPERAMNDAIAWSSASETLYPFYWIDPMREDACDLVDMAVEKGMYGFKAIASRFYPGDERAMKVYERIAKTNRPLMFHSGILWDGLPSCQFNRPGNFEALIDIPNLRFALAHISWPWCEECVAVYGKFLNALTRCAKPRAEMFVDITPGTPKIRRKNALEMLHCSDYDVTDHVMFGTDCRANGYNADWCREWQQRDDAIYAELGFDADKMDSVYRRAFQAFLFGGDRSKLKLPTPDALPERKWTV